MKLELWFHKKIIINVDFNVGFNAAIMYFHIYM